jgi:DNA-binding NarL/FixJ family response regulator
VRRALAPAAFATSWAAGRALPVEAVIAEALVDVEPATAAAGLSAREAEVPSLLAEGLGDREIAAALSISPRTVGGHITNLLREFRVGSRTAAAAFAVRHGLA